MIQTRRTIPTLAILILSSLFSRAAALEPKLNFDQGLDLPSLIKNLKTEATAPLRHGISHRPAPLRTERDCAVFSFRKDEPLVSERVSLESREYVERCYNDPRGGQHCREEWVWTERRHVRMQIEGRGEMLPWERDLFELCLEGRHLSGYVLDASHAYKLKLRSDDDTVRAVAGGKTPSLPDPAGVYVSSLRSDPPAKNLVLALKDRWASYYKGEQVVATLILKRHRENWFDDTLLEKELTFPTSDSYTVRFAEYAKEFSQELQAGKKYYLKWRFKRVGQISKDKWTKYWESDKTEYTMSLAPFSGFVEAAAMRTCWFKDIEGNQCVYRCRDGSDYRQPVRTPDPWDRDRGDTIACPQLVFPF